MQTFLCKPSSTFNIVLPGFEKTGLKEYSFKIKRLTHTLVHPSAEVGDKKSEADIEGTSDAAAEKIDENNVTVAPKEADNENKEHEPSESGSDQKGKEESDRVDGSSKEVVGDKGGEQQSVVEKADNEENMASSEGSDDEIGEKQSDPEKGNRLSLTVDNRSSTLGQ